jgi:hypothetical protein
VELSKKMGASFFFEFLCLGQFFESVARKGIRMRLFCVQPPQQYSIKNMTSRLKIFTIINVVERENVRFDLLYIYFALCIWFAFLAMGGG